MISQVRDDRLDDFKHKGLHRIDRDVIPRAQSCQAAIVGETVQGPLHHLLAPAVDRRPFAMNISMDPPELLQVSTVSLTMRDDVVPPSILLLFVGRRPRSNWSLLCAEGKMHELHTSQVLEHPLQCLAGLHLVVGPPRYFMPLPSNKFGHTVAFDLVVEHVEVLDDADLAIDLWDKEELRDVPECRPLLQCQWLRKLVPRFVTQDGL